MGYMFLNDYSESAHPAILQALTSFQLTQFTGYGTDDYSTQVKDKIRHKLAHEPAGIYFTTSGTQTNLVCINALLTPIDGIIACDSGHIASNEAGAIEALGHKVIVAKHQAGKLTVAEIERIRQLYHHRPHVVRVKAIYISNSTEYGTVYTKDELRALYAYCQQHNMFVFMDGARLGSALASDYQDMQLSDMAKYTDLFWLGGTKMGALFGEMVVINNEQLAEDFAIYLKQKGALLAKGFVLAAQFDVLLTDDNYLSWCRHANMMATKLSQGIEYSGYELFVPTQSNQVFAILPDPLIAKLSQSFTFYTWQALAHERSVIRLIASWATPQVQIERFLNVLTKLS